MNFQVSAVAETGLKGLRSRCSSSLAACTCASAAVMFIVANMMTAPAIVMLTTRKIERYPSQSVSSVVTPKKSPTHLTLGKLLLAHWHYALSLVTSAGKVTLTVALFGTFCSTLLAIGPARASAAVRVGYCRRTGRPPKSPSVVINAYASRT
jgi:hypothetical protein